MQPDLDLALKKIRSRARALIRFSYRMQNAQLDEVRRDRAMTIARAAVRVLRDSAREYLEVSQPRWSQLTREERQQAVAKAFEDERREEKELRGEHEQSSIDSDEPI